MAFDDPVVRPITARSGHREHTAAVLRARRSRCRRRLERRRRGRRRSASVPVPSSPRPVALFPRHRWRPRNVRRPAGDTVLLNGRPGGRHGGRRRAGDARQGVRSGDYGA